MFWTIGKGVLWLLDGFFSIIDKIWRYQFFNNEYVNKIFSGAIIVACSWLILKVVINFPVSYFAPLYASTLLAKVPLFASHCLSSLCRCLVHLFSVPMCPG